MIGKTLWRLKHKVLPFPWWIVIVGYLFALALVIICIYFMVVFGAALGEDLTTQWLIAMLIGILKSILIIEPVKVNKNCDELMLL